MSVGGEPGHVHPVASQRNGYHYLFYDKHHGHGGPKAAQWVSNLSPNEELGIFDQADLLDLGDKRGNLYGIRLRLHPERQILVLGTLGQQIAEFHDSGSHWHGYPLWPLEKTLDPPHPPKRKPPEDVLQKMVNAGLLTREERKRLWKGKHA